MDENYSEQFLHHVSDVKSKKVYEKWYAKYMEYCSDNSQELDSIKSLTDFFLKLKENYKISTLWQAYACLNKYLQIKNGWKDFKHYPLLKNFLKNIEKTSEIKKKAPTFSSGEIQDFLNDGPEIGRGLTDKVACILGYFEGLRIQEIVNITFESIEDRESHFKVNVTSDKTDPSCAY